MVASADVHGDLDGAFTELPGASAKPPWRPPRSLNGDLHGASTELHAGSVSTSMVYECPVLSSSNENDFYRL